jgi:acyl-coenzyme A synthetase/AMP-(fatty) acid ligase
MHPADLVIFWARMNPEQPAIVQSDMALTYGDVKQAVDAIVKRIERYHFTQNEPVAVAIPHPARQLLVCLALMRCGIPAVPISQGALFYVRQAGIDTVVHAGQGLMTAGGRNIQYEDSWLKRDDKASIAPNSAARNSVGAGDVIFVTLGSAGVAKKLIVPGSAILDRIKWLPVSGEASFERALIVSDLSSPSGFLPALMQLCAGKTLCFAPHSEAQLLLIETFGIESIVTSRQELQGLLACVETRSGHQCSSVREIKVESGTLWPDLIRRVQSRLCRNVILEYASPEAGLIASANYDVVARVPEAVGLVMPGVIIEAIDENDAVMPVGTTGLVRVRSNYFSKVFVANNPDRVPEALHTWWYPGARGRVDEKGVLSIETRVDR